MQGSKGLGSWVESYAYVLAVLALAVFALLALVAVTAAPYLALRREPLHGRMSRALD